MTKRARVLTVCLAGLLVGSFMLLCQIQYREGSPPKQSPHVETPWQHQTEQRFWQPIGGNSSAGNQTETKTVVIGKELTESEVIAHAVIASYNRYDTRYGKLFNKLGVDSDGIDKLKQLFILRDAQTSALMRQELKNSRQIEVFYGGRNESISVYKDDPANWPAEFAAVKASTEVQIHDLLGDDGYAIYANYEQTTILRSEVSQIQDLLTKNGIPPLDDGQIENIVAVSYTYSPDAKYAGRVTNITEQAINDFKSTLSAEQLQVIVNYQHEAALHQAAIDTGIASAKK